MQSSGSYFGGGFFTGNNSQQVNQMKTELEQVNEDLQLAQEELIAKIQENEMVNIKIYEQDKEFREQEKSFEVKITDLQKRQHQLEQEITEKETEMESMKSNLEHLEKENET